jgi:hypothetical protein
MYVVYDPKLQADIIIGNITKDQQKQIQKAVMKQENKTIHIKNNVYVAITKQEKYITVNYLTLF